LVDEDVNNPVLVDGDNSNRGNYYLI